MTKNTVTVYTPEQIDEWIKKIKSGVMNPNKLVSLGNKNSVNLLDAAISSKLTKKELLDRVEKLIELGCDVDAEGVFTPIERAIMQTMNYTDVVYLMLQHHKSNHLDLEIIKTSFKSPHAEALFPVIVGSDNINTNEKTIYGDYILHIMIYEGIYNPTFVNLILDNPKTISNPLNSEGESPLTLAINIDDSSAISALKHNIKCRIIGKVNDPKKIIHYELVDRYNGDFWKDHPDMLQYAYKFGKFDMLPPKISSLLF
jgi:hypothetical protein